MSKEIYQITKDSINSGYQSKNKNIIEKETDYLLGKIITLFTSSCFRELKSLHVDLSGLSFYEEYLLSGIHKKNLFKWLDRLTAENPEKSVTEFGKLKVDFEHWYYQLGGENITFDYHQSYLLTPAEAANSLGVSKVTLNKYVKQGLEVVDTTSHHKIPKHAVELWKDPIYSIRMQLIAQEKMLINQSPEDRLKEVVEEITEFQIKYKVNTFKEAFSAYNGDEMDDPTDYYRWMDLEEEKEEIMKLLKEG